MKDLSEQEEILITSIAKQDNQVSVFICKKYIK